MIVVASAVVADGGADISGERLEFAQDICDITVSVWCSCYRCVVFGGVAAVVLGMMCAHGELIDHWLKRVVCVW